MTDQFPQCDQVYDTDVSNSEIWSRFEQRSDDIIISTPPKCGTTWMQSICGLMVFEDPDANPGIGTTSKWLDSKFNDEAEVMAELEDQTHRRYIKTHTPLDGITYDKDCTYICVYRHPIDVVFSLQSHLKNMKNDGLKRYIADDINVAFQSFANQPTHADQNIGETVESLVNHYKSFAKWQALPNIHMFHYADMSRDLRASISRLSEILCCDFDDEVIDEITSATTFSNMKKNANKFAPSVDRDIWKDNAQFFASGTSKKWEGILSEQSLEMYHNRMSELLTPEEVAWLENGDNC